MQCKLCRDSPVEIFFSDPPRTYLHCKNCELIFTTADSYLTLAQERERYEMHDNTVTNNGYVRFLDTVAKMVIECTPPEGSVLDFGSGKNAVLETIISRQCNEVQCESYDPQFDRLINFSEKKYDTIVLCEVIEHIRDLQGELECISSILKANGKVIIRTQKYSSLEKFANWWYRQDTTHINFFNDLSLSFAASLLKRRCFPTACEDIVILQPENS